MKKDGKTSQRAYTARGMCIVTGELLPEIDEGNTEMHGRTVEAGNALKLGYYIFTKFLSNKNIIDSEKQKQLECEANKCIDDLLNLNTEMIIDSKPTTMFFNALEQLIATKQIKLREVKDKRDISVDEGRYFGGFIDIKENILYLIPDVIFNKVRDFYNKSGINFTFNSKTLWKQLADENYIETHIDSEKKCRNTIQKTVNGKKYQVLKLLLPKETIQSYFYYCYNSSEILSAFSIVNSNCDDYYDRYTRNVERDYF